MIKGLLNKPKPPVLKLLLSKNIKDFQQSLKILTFLHNYGKVVYYKPFRVIISLNLLVF